MAAAGTEDDNLTDNDLQSEIELVGDLVVAASASEGPLPQDQVDLLLGVPRDRVQRHDGAPLPEPDSC